MKTMKRWLSALLCAAMIFGMMPMHVFAADADGLTTTTIDGETYYQIGNADDLYAFAELVNGGSNKANGLLTADIVVNENVLKEDGTLNGTPSRGWNPIGNNYSKYSGTFDGDGHTVSGLYKSGTTNYVGMFSSISEGGTVKNLGILDSYFCGGYNVGGVVGSSFGTLYNCYNTGTVISEQDYAVSGGVVGLNYGLVSNCYNTGNISGDDEVGGVVGFNDGGIITECYNAGSVRCNWKAGGVVSTSCGTVSNCYNLGDVCGDGFDVGGVMGENWEGTVSNCFSTGNISGDFRQTAGVVYKNYSGTVTNCYYLTGTATTGGSGNVAAKSKAEFASGEIAYLLQGEQETHVWGQNVGTDDYPTLGGEKVYYGYMNCSDDTEACYTNDASARVEKPAHSMGADNTCGVCGYVCSHTTFADSKCALCGFECKHDIFTDGKCPCGRTGGYCGAEEDGKNLTWTLVDGTLTIKGEGAMMDYDVANDMASPWFELRNEILSIVIEEGVTTIGNEAFVRCEKATEIQIADSVTKLGRMFMARCVKMEQVTIPDKVTVIPEYAFAICTVLTDVVLPSGIETIEANAFKQCVKFTNVVIPDNVTSIGSSAFYGCSRLQSVTIGKGMNEIAENAFAGCPALENLTWLADGEVTLGTDVFGGDTNTENITLTLTSASVGQMTDNVTWNGYTFKSIQVLCSDGTLNHSMDLYTTNGDGTHKHACSVCGYSLQENCTGGEGTATCVSGQICDLCTAPYGETDPYAHTGPYTARFNWPEDINAYYWTVDLICGGCGESVAEADVFGEMLEGEIKTPGDCETPDVVTYTVTVTLDEQEYTEQRDYEIPSANHANLDANGFCTCGGYQAAVYNEDENVYEISNAGQLYWYAQHINWGSDANGILTADITIPENAPNWEPINGSSVRFDGNFHTISGLHCVSEENYVGFFGMEGWWYGIENLHITDSYFEGGRYTGAIVAYLNNGGSVTNCYVTNTTVKGDGKVGDLVGDLTSGSVTNCYTDGAKLVGYNYGGYGIITNSYYLSETETEDGGRTAEQFAIGQVAYELQAGVPGEDIYDDDWNWVDTITPHVWGQTIGTDAYPTLGGKKVYVGYGSCADYEKGYTNISATMAEKPEHSVAEATCVSPATCVGCGQTYGEADPDAHAEQIIYNNLGEQGHEFSYPCCQYSQQADHEFDSETLLCICGEIHEDALALVSENGVAVKAYTDLQSALYDAESYAAEDHAVVKVLTDVDLGDADVSIYAGVFTLDLNGFTLTSACEGSGSMYLDGDFVVTVCNGTIHSDFLAVQLRQGALTLEDMVLESNYALSVESGDVIVRGCDLRGWIEAAGGVLDIYDSIINCPDRAAIAMRGGTVILHEGTLFPGGICVSGMDLNDLLADGMAYWVGDTMVVPESDAVYIEGEVTVKKACTHENAALEYTWKNAEEHDAVYSCCNGKQVEPHVLDEDGICVHCGFDLDKTMVIRMYDDYGDGWNGNAIEIYENGQLIDTVTMEDGTSAEWIDAYDSQNGYRFLWIDGSYSEECSFEIMMGGEVVFTASTDDCAAFDHGQQIYPVCEHEFDEGVTVESTCQNPGYTVYTCTLCGYSYKEEFASALAHTRADDDEGTIVPPTCDEDGYTLYTCTVCGETFEDDWVSALGHTKGDVMMVIPPSCDGYGCTLYMCSVCNSLFGDDPVNKLGHTLGEDGNCTVCGEYYILPVSLGDHQIQAENLADICGDGTASYDPATNTLTLNGYQGGQIYSEQSLDIVLLGENVITDYYYGMYIQGVDCDVNISGTGRLTINAGNRGIWVPGANSIKLTIGGNAAVEMNAEGMIDEGILLTANYAELVIKDNATLIAGTEDVPMEEECIYVDAALNGSVTITDNATVRCITNDEEGIYVNGESQSISISGNADVYVNADKEGLQAEDIQISGGNVTAIGGEGYEGIFADNLTISGGLVTAAGGEQGIEADNITITGGTVIVTAGGMIADDREENGEIIPGTLILGEGMAITDPAGATIGELDMTELGEGIVQAVLNPDGTVADAFTITEADAPIRITLQPESVKGKVGETAVFTVAAEGEGLTYQWYYYNVAQGEWLKSYSPGYNSDTLSVTVYAYRDGQQYRCVITDAYGNSVTSQTAVMTLDVDDLGIASISGDVVGGAIGKTYTFSVDATGDNLTYLWQVSTDGGETWAQTWLSGYNTDTLNVKFNANRDGNLYRCIVSCGGKESITSEPMGLYLQEASVEIQGISDNVKASIGENATFTVTAAGIDLSYAWYRSYDNGATWEMTYLPGYNTDTLSFEVNANRTGLFLCKVTDGSGKTVCSDVVRLTLCAQIVTMPESVDCAIGDTATFTVAATGENLRYQWYYSADGGETWVMSYLTGYNTETLSFYVNASRASRIYKCVITDRDGATLETDAVSVNLG